MKKTSFSRTTAVLAALLCAAGTLWADDIVVADAGWKITYVEAEQAFRLNALNEAGASLKCAINHSAPVARYDLGGEEREVTPSSFAQVEYQSEDVTDAFGQGTCHRFVFTTPSNGDAVTLTQRFFIYPGRTYMLTDLVLEGDEALRSNYLSPVAVVQPYTLYLSNSNNRMLKVPFDNDGFCRYHRYKMDAEVTSYEVSALYEGESRNGLVLGSVDHDHWKSAVWAKMSSNGRIDEMRVFSGVSDSETRDDIPHGKLRGPLIASARMFVGWFADWREGMEEFARANNVVAPKTESWEHGTPFGWQSWGVLAEKCSYSSALEIANYYANTLTPLGFSNSQGKVMLSLDASDGMSGDQHAKFIQNAEGQGQMVGCYSTPFSMWCGDNSWDDIVYTNASGVQYKRRDVVLHVNGQPKKYDGAYCMDPTHPYTKICMRNFLTSTATYGFKYVKMDFVNCGIIQADSYYNKDVTTAVEAYNEGMAYVKKWMDTYGLFGALSIAPLFPYQYANSRRITCDSWGSIGWSEYSMNAITGGWWTDGLYQYNDPDGLVLVGANDQINNSIAENRARYTNGAVSGMMLVSDNFSLSDATGRGNAELSRQRSLEIMLNRDINEMADMGRSFRPIYGYKEYNSNHDGAESFVMRHTDKYLYVAIINYMSGSKLSGRLPLSLLDIAEDDFSEVRELWTGIQGTIVDGSLEYSIPVKDACVYRFTKKGDTGVQEADGRRADDLTVARVAQDCYYVQSALPMRQVDCYDVQGRLLGTTPLASQTKAEVALPARTRGMVLMRVTLADGQVRTLKLR